MIEASTVYEKAITTHRTAETMSRVHGFESIAQLAESLPEGAQVLDVGAGASPFGKEIAALRSDITWTNFDYSYREPAILEEVSKDSPPNVAHIAGDATKLEDLYEPERFDAVFSYWLLPHLSLDDPIPAQEAARGIFRLTKSGGFISAGPRIGKGCMLTFKPREAHHFIKDAALDERTFTDILIHETQLKGRAREVQKLANEVATPFFGTTRYAVKKGKVPHIYHPESQDYVSPFSRKGVQVAARLAVAANHHIIQQRKAKKQ